MDSVVPASSRSARNMGYSPSKVDSLVQKRSRENLLNLLAEDADFEWLMLDTSSVKVHPDASGAKGGNQEMARDSTPGTILP